MGRSLSKVTPFNAYLGTEIVRRGKGEIVVALQLGPHHLNRRGVAHGGVIAALLDTFAAAFAEVRDENRKDAALAGLLFLDRFENGRNLGVGDRDEVEDTVELFLGFL